MKELCILIRPYQCMYCKGDTLAFVTHGNKLIDYKKLFDSCYTSMDFKKILDDYEISYLKCNNCKRLSHISWEHGYPVQTNDKYLRKQFSPHRD